MLADTRARADDLTVAQRRTNQQNQIRDGAEVASLAKEMVEGLLSSGSMSRSELVEYVHAGRGRTLTAGSRRCRR